MTELRQKDPIRFGTKKLYLSTFGSGPVSAVRVNGAPWPAHDAESVTLAYDKTPDTAAVEIYLGGPPGPGPPRQRDPVGSREAARISP